MKKLLFILLLTSNGFAQSNGYNAYLTNISPDTVCINQVVSFTVKIDTGLLNQPNRMIKVLDSIGNYTQYVIGGTIQQWIDSGFVMRSPMYPGTLNMGKNKIGIWFGFTNDTHVLYQRNCYQDIIENSNISDPISIEYFNLLGQPIKEPNGLTVEMSTYQSGKKSIRKIMR